MRWGSADTFVSSDPWGFRMGRPIANEGFLRALLRYGSYDQYDIYCTDMNNLEAFDSWLEESFSDATVRQRVKPLLHVALAENLQEVGYDAFHFGDFTSLLPHMVEARNRLAPRPFPITGITHSLDGLLMSTRYQQLVQADLAPYDAVVCTSACAEDTVRKGLDWARGSLGADVPPSPVRLERVPLALDDSLLEPASRAEARKMFELPDDVTVALCVGRVALRQKTDWAPVLANLARMRAAGGLDKLVVVIAGGGEEADFALLDQLIQMHGLGTWVVPLPNFDPAVKPFLYAAADFYFSLVDNFQETFGLTILEAMASGLPVVCSEFNGYRELVDHGKTGLLIPTAWIEEVPAHIQAVEGVLQDSLVRLYLAQMLAVDLEEMERAFRFMVTNVEARVEMAAAARERASRFTWERVIGEYEALWARLRDIAEHSDWRPAAGPMRLKQDPSHAYSHYSSRLVGASSRLQVTGIGEEALAAPGTLVRYDDTRVLLFDELEKLLLGEVCQGPRSLADLRAAATAALGVQQGLVDFHVMWLLKHGALRLDP